MCEPSITDTRLGWCDIYLKAVDIHYRLSSDPELDLSGIEYILGLAREEIENPSGVVTGPASPDEDDDPAAPYISFEGGVARIVRPGEN